MKPVLFVLLLSVFTVTSSAADYLVVRVKGNAGIGNKTLKSGDTLSTQSTILFGGNAPVLWLVNSEGTYTLSPPSNGTVGFSACTLTPLNRVASAPQSEGPVNDIGTYFNDSIFVFVGEKLQLKLTERHAPGEQHFLLYRYKYKGQIVSSRISHDKAGSITLEKKHLYTLMDKKTEVSPDSVSKVDILNYEAGSRTFTILATFRAIWLDSELKSELSVLNAVYQQKGFTEEQKNAEFISYVQRAYGKTDEPALKNWIRSNVLK